MQDQQVKKPPLAAIPFVRLPSTALVMAFIAGFADVFGFITLSKLFTAHITGNIVIAIAEIISHSPGVTTKLIAIPVFTVIAMVVTWVIEHFGQTKPLLILLLSIEAIVLTAFMVAGYYVVPLQALDSWQYISTGMLAVSAMAMHNILLRTFMTSLPPCTAMTGNFCHFIVDVMSYGWGKKMAYPVENLAASKAGIKRFGNVLIGFSFGGLVAAIGIVTIGFWMISLIILLLIWMSLQIYMEK